jgi:hypothetical protein
MRSTPTGDFGSRSVTRPSILPHASLSHRQEGGNHSLLATRLRAEHAHSSVVQNMAQISSVLAFVLLWSTSATAIDTPAARLYRALTDVCLERYLRNNDLNTAQLNTGRPLIVHCDCMARFLFPDMDDEAIRQFETGIPDKVTSNWDDAAQRCSTLILR